MSIIEHGPKGEIKAQGSVYTTNGSERYIASHISHGQFLEMENDKATESELDRLIRTANTAFHPTVSSKK